MASLTTLTLVSVLAPLIIALPWLMVRKKRPSAAECPQQFDIVAPAAVARTREKLPGAEDRTKFDQLIRLVQMHYPLRLGHLTWALEHLQDRVEDLVIPPLKPPPGRYRAQEDVGLLIASAYLAHKLKSEWHEGFKALERGAELDSPICMDYLGRAMLKGERGFDQQEQAGRKLLESAAEHGRAVPTLGMALIHGVGGPVDVSRGVSVLEKAASQEIVYYALLARLFWYGTSHLPADRERAMNYLMNVAPWWRVALRSVGFEHCAWAEKVLSAFKEATDEVSSLSSDTVSRQIKKGGASS